MEELIEEGLITYGVNRDLIEKTRLNSAQLEGIRSRSLREDAVSWLMEGVSPLSLPSRESNVAEQKWGRGGEMPYA